jgi:hypothetical protein
MHIEGMWRAVVYLSCMLDMVDMVDMLGSFKKNKEIEEV